MEPLSFASVTIDKVNSAIAEQKNCSFSVLRLDKISDLISGNKIFKLNCYLQEAIEQGKGIMTWGGAYSNHIIATAAACNLHQLPCIGIIRGEEPRELSFTLQQALAIGMKLCYTSREDYRDKKIPEAIATGHFIAVPEGGFGPKGAKGASKITAHFSASSFTHILCAVGTGTTLAGLMNASATPVTGISVMKNNTELELMTRSLLINQQQPVTILHDYHFGGYAKHTAELLRFMNDFYRHSMIPSDFVYTAKLFFAVDDLLKKDFFPAGSRILAIHSGGLQGNQSLDKGTLIF